MTIILGALGMVLTFVGGIIAEKIKARSSDHAASTAASAEVEAAATTAQLQASAAAEGIAASVLRDVLTRQTALEAKVTELENALSSLSWRYLLALDSIKEHRDDWPDSRTDKPAIHPAIAFDLEHGPVFYQTNKEVRA